jgi:hypothetical protein
MTTSFTILSVCSLRNGQLLVAGAYTGEPLKEGQRGRTSTPFGEIELEIVGTAIVDPNLVAPNRQGVLAKLLKGDEQSLKGATLEFELGNKFG